MHLAERRSLFSALCIMMTTVPAHQGRVAELERLAQVQRAGKRRADDRREQRGTHAAWYNGVAGPCMHIHAG